MSVLHVLGSSKPGGTETNVIRLAEGASAGFSHAALLLDEPGAVSQQLERLGVSVTHAPWTRVLGAFRAAGALRLLLQDGDFDVVQLYGLRANTVGRVTCRLTRWPGLVVGGLRSLYPSGIKSAWTLWADRLTFRWCAGHISNSEVAAQHLISHGYPPDKFWVIPQGIDTDRFAPADSPLREQIRASLGIEDRVPVLACVAHFRPVKNHETLLRACALLKEKGAAFRLLLAGDGPLRETLESLAAALGLREELQFLGRLGEQDVIRLLQAADIALLASRVEGLPTALLEAMACGCAVVATDVGGTRELVAAGETGQLVEPGDPAALAAAVAGLLGDPAGLERMQHEARQRARDCFSLSRMIEEYEALIARLTSRLP